MNKVKVKGKNGKAKEVTSNIFLSIFCGNTSEFTVFIMNISRNLIFITIFALSVVLTGISPSVALANNWDIQTVDMYGDKGSDNSIALDSFGRPHISYREFDWWNITDYLKYASWDGNKWNVGYIDWAGDVGFGSSLAIDKLDRPHISYYDAQINLKYAKWNGSTWQILILDKGQYPSLALDGYGNPHIGFFKPYYVYIGNLQVLKADLLYYFWDGNNWQKQTVDSGLYFKYESPKNPPKLISLALDHFGKPHIAYRDFGVTSGKLKYAVLNGTTWQIQTVDNQGDAGLDPSLAMNSLDQPCISYMGGAYSLRYATWNGSSWQFQTVDARPGMYNLPNSLRLDTADRAHISYYDGYSVPSALKYASWNGGAWQIETIDSYSAGLTNSLILDSKNQPHISYYLAIDGTGGASLKYATKLGVAMGGTAIDMGLSKAVCSNLSTKQVVGAPVVSNKFDCTGAGFIANAGDRITLTAKGEATQNKASGEVTGMNIAKVVCSNLSTRQVIGAAVTNNSWDCVASGLSVFPNDRITMTIKGGVL